MAKKKEEPQDPPAQPDNTDGGGGEPKHQRMAPPEPGPEPTPEPEPQPEPTEPPKEPESEKTFSQADLDKIVKDRLEREKKKYADYSDLKKRAEKWDEHEKSQMDEVDRLRLELEQANVSRTEIEKQATQQMKYNALLAGITSYSNDKGIGFRKDAIEAALKLADDNDLELSDGQVTGVNEVVKKLAEQHAFLLEVPRSGLQSSPTNAARTEPAGETDKDRRARYFGGGQRTGFFKSQDNVVYPEQK